MICIIIYEVKTKYLLYSLKFMTIAWFRIFNDTYKSMSMHLFLKWTYVYIVHRNRMTVSVISEAY